MRQRPVPVWVNRGARRPECRDFDAFFPCFAADDRVEIVHLVATDLSSVYCFILSVAGGLYVFNHQFISLEAVHWRALGETIVITLLGGAGTIWGQWVGFALVLLIRSSLSAITDTGSVMLGLLFVTVVMLFRRGLLGRFLHGLLHGASARARPSRAMPDATSEEGPDAPRPA